MLDVCAAKRRSSHSLRFSQFHVPAWIEVDGLVKTYGSATVVDGVTFHVAEGEIFGLLGSNGAGKTTTVECLQGLRRPDRGRLRVLGLDPVMDHGRLRALIGVNSWTRSTATDDSADNDSSLARLN